MQRFRRLRSSAGLRELVRETTLSVKNLIYPIFVTEGENIRCPVASMPGISKYSLDTLPEILNEVAVRHIPGILLFGVPEQKDSCGSGAWSENGITQRAIRRVKALHPDLLVIADVCLCEYTDHGHCGLIRNGRVLNDETLPVLAKISVSSAKAGADLIAPSDMMDGRVAAIRAALDDNGFLDTPIMAYSAKFASAYYGPFREAAQSVPAFGDRKTYQMDYANGREALREMEADLAEGADILMVKPALACLDILRAASDRFDLPLAVYNVSGEYAMVKAAAIRGWIDERRIVIENLTAMRRAGAAIILTYHALDAADWLDYCELSPKSI